MANNPYFNAIEARDSAEARSHFNRLISNVRHQDQRIDYDSASERVVSGLICTAGYCDDDTRRRVSRLYSHYSPYRR